MKSICFIAHDAFGALAGGAFGHVGGVERQTSLMSKWFAARGYDVSVLTWDEGQPDECVVDGVRVIKVCRRDAGWRGVRFVHPRWTALNRALRRADADLYYHNSAEYVTGQVAAWCRRHKRRFVYSVASDPACDPALPLFDTLRERVLYRYGIRACDHLIVQHRKQRSMIREGFGRDATPLPMPCPGPTRAEYQPPVPPGPDAPVVWIGRVAAMKRLELLLDLAAALPSVKFQVVGGGDSAYAKQVLERARTMNNVSVLGTVPREQMPSIYRHAACLCCTSSYEGFPNTFLEAWSHGLPVVSTFDPDGLVVERTLGVVAHALGGLTEAVRGILSNPQQWREFSRNARGYYVERHTPEVAIPQFERVFLDLFPRTEATSAAPILALTE